MPKALYIMLFLYHFHIKLCQFYANNNILQKRNSKSINKEAEQYSKNAKCTISPMKK